MREVARFARWCSLRLEQIRGIHLAACREEVSRVLFNPGIKRHFSALWMMFAWFVEQGVFDRNPVREVKTPMFTRSEGNPPASTPEEKHQHFESLDTDSIIAPRNRALIGVTAFTFARVDAATLVHILRKPAAVGFATSLASMTILEWFVAN